MSVLLDVCYLVGLLLAAPLLVIKSLRTGKYRTDWAARFGRYPRQGPRPTPASGTPPPGRRLMLHCVSVGELLSIRELADRLLAADPALQLVITTTTDTGTARARAVYGAEPYRDRVQTYRFPLDFSFAVAGFFDHAQPDLVALVELETWPNFMAIAQRRRIPVVVINGRMTERSLRRYRLIRPVMRGMLRRCAWIAVQTRTIAERFAALGAPRAALEVVPTLRYDTADLSDTLPGADALARACGITPRQQLFVGGSTGPDEETPLLAAYRALREKHPQLRLAIAPRKPETVAPVLAAIRAAGLTPVQRTARPDGPDGAPLTADEVLVLDTLGELKKLYALAYAIFVGRSLVALGGSDMIEAVALGKPVCFGPHAFNFAEAVELLTQQSGAVVVATPAALTATVGGWLDDPAAAAALAARGRAVIAAQRGSTQRYVERLLEMLASRARP